MKESIGYESASVVLRVEEKDALFRVLKEVEEKMEDWHGGVKK